MRRYPRRLPLLALAGALAWLAAPACAPDPNGPGPTARLFWDALATDDYAAAEALTAGATLAEVREFGSAHDFDALELGEPLDNASLAEVPTRMQRRRGAALDLSFQTHLVRGEAGWRVDLRQTRRDLTRELLASSFEGVQEALRESSEAFVEEFEERALEASEALRETLEELEKSLNDPQQPGTASP